MRTKIYLFIFLIFFSSQTAKCIEASEQTLAASLGNILEISKIIVENIEHDRDVPLIGVQKKTNTPSNPNLNIITLTPMQVKIHTNMSTPISITAEFQEMKHTSNLYNY